MELTYGSLFTGIGGLDLGLDRAGFHCRWQIENDPYAVKVLEKRWPEVKRYGDITTVQGADLEPVDLICGGFPCQDLSQAGKRIGIEGTRSGLWFEYARLVRELRPRYVLIENVPGLLVSDAMRRVVGELARLGYVGCYRSLRASEFGASHLRKRVFIVAHAEREPVRAQQLDHQRERKNRGTIDGSVPGIAGSGALAHGDGRGLLGSIDGPECGAGDGEAQPAGNVPDVAHRNGGRRQIERRGGLLDGERETRGYDVNGCDPHVAHGTLRGLGELREPSGCNGLPDGSHQNLGDAASTQGGRQLDACGAWKRRPQSGGAIRAQGLLSHTNVTGLAQRERERSHDGALQPPSRSQSPGLRIERIQFAPGPSDPQWPFILRERPDLAPALSIDGAKALREASQSAICGMADGLSAGLDRSGLILGNVMQHRTKRLGRLGNAVVPQIAEWIGTRILEFERSTNT